MTIIKRRPTSPGRRFQVFPKKTNISKKKPFKSLVRGIKESGGRNNAGRITCRHKGKRVKRKYRIIDFKRNKDNIPGVIESIQYDPNRSALISLILYRDGERRYILHPKGMKKGDKICSGKKVDLKIGNCLPLKYIRDGSIIHCIEIYPGKGAKISRSAGTYSTLLGKEGKYATIRTSSKEVRKINLHCKATIGQISHDKNNLRSYGKAGIKRLKGIRPTVRGVAMNPVDHPHGGGEGRSSGGQQRTPWGVFTKGKKTRKNKRTKRFIIKRKIKK